MVDVSGKESLRRHVVTSKILNPRKIEENKRQSRNIGFEADLLIIFKFPHNVFFTTSLRLHSERLTAFYIKNEGTDFETNIVAKVNEY